MKEDNLFAAKRDCVISITYGGVSCLLKEPLFGVVFLTHEEAYLLSSSSGVSLD